MFTGCATWADDDQGWLAEDDASASPDPSVVFGYGGTPREPSDPAWLDEPLSDDVAPESDEAPIGEEARGESARFGERHSNFRCTLRMVTATVRPHLSASDIRATVRRHENDIRACYNRALRRDRTLQGRVVMRFLITGDGTVGAAFVASTQIEHPLLHSCLMRTVKRWTFPVAPGTSPSVVNYPYVFSAA
jgi:outer membrane biosynthesis protein TonB